PEKPLVEYVYYRLNADISTLDPAYITDVNNGSIASKINRGLVKLDENMNLVSDIAERWEILDKGRRYRFYLKTNITFSNGRTVTAHDFKYSYERIMKKETLSPNRWLFERVKDFYVKSDTIFEIHLKEAFTPFLNMLTVPAAFVLPIEEVNKLGKDFAFKPVGAGEYYLDKWQTGIEIRLNLRKDLKHNKDIKGIIYKIIPEDITAITEFELGRLDILGVPNNAYGRFIKDIFWQKRLISIQSLNTYYLGMNTDKYPFNNTDIRKAVAMAIDREKILNTFWEKRGRLARGIVPDLLRDWDLNEKLIYSPEESKKILNQKGIKELNVLMLVSAEQDNVDLAEIIQRYLSEVGIKVVIRQMEWSAYKEAINKGQADLFWLSWWADYPDPENFLFPLFHSSNKGYGGNRTRFTNKEVDLLLEKARSKDNSKEAKKIYRDIENIILKEFPLIPFWHRNDYVIIQPWMKGFKGFPVYTMDKGLNLIKNISGIEKAGFKD
ncbi:MAG: ABC transporter substrate-binding protein, partial [Thermodesulfovibrionales bacterium]|nr:ABC transporter substrate-binding protein [Thermodesulfovibrionales bacterium]